MEKEFIPYKQALALKELGFDEPCLDFYDNNKELFYNHENKEKIHIGDSVKAPLYQQAFRWFREKGYDTSISHMPPEMIGKGRIKKYSLFIWKEDSNPRGIQEFKDTYEEAELECLKKLIEIVKSK